MAMRYELVLPAYSVEFVGVVESVATRIFESVQAGYVSWRFRHMPDVSVFCALEGEEFVGFKAGYAMSERKYYSWLGGVLPAYRGKGVAGALMDKQHEWLEQRGYEVVETSVNQQNRAMAQLNLRHGYEACGIRAEPNRVQVLYSKRL